MRRAPSVRSVLLAIVVLASLLVTPASRATVSAQEASASAGVFRFAIAHAEQHGALPLPGFPDPFTPANGAYLLVWLSVTNTGAAPAEYDYCPPEQACLTPGWFAAVANDGAAYPVDETVRAAVELAQPAGAVLPFGATIPAGSTAQIILVFDVPAAGEPWQLRSAIEAAAPFALAMSLTQPTVAPDQQTITAGMNQTITLGDIDLMATRAELRPAIELAAQPQPFIPQGEYLVVFLTITNRGGAAQYDICPPGGQTCLNQLWFQATDAQGAAYPVEPVAWAAFSLQPKFLPFGSDLAPGAPEPIALVFDVPAGEQDWTLASTGDAPRPFSIQLQLSPAPGTIQVVRPENGGEGGSAAAVELILDTSGSMLQPLEGQRRIDIARDVLGELVAKTIPPGTPLALRVFGDTPESCETLLAAPLQPLDPAAMAGQITGLDAVDGVNTPIGAALAQVANDLQGVEGSKIVVLVTDGEETCGGDPAAALRDIAAQGIDARVNIVGFAVADDALKAQFREWAHLGNGQYFDAAGAADLGAAITAAVQPPFRILDASGAEVARGLVDGPPVEVPAGTYRVEVQAASPVVFNNVTIGSGARAVIPLRTP